MSPCQCNEGPAASAAAFKPHRHDPHRAGATRRNRLADASQTRDALKASDGKWPSRSVLTEPPATQEKKLAAVPQLFSVHRALGGPSPLPPGCSAPSSFRFIGALGGTFSATPEKTGTPSHCWPGHRIPAMALPALRSQRLLLTTRLGVLLGHSPATASLVTAAAAQTEQQH